MDQFELQALSLTVMALVQALAANGSLEETKWNALLDKMVTKINALEKDHPEASTMRAQVAERMDFYKILPITE